ncbi:MAG: exosortase/archaeosortase family protein [Acidobacteriia bacterium]|nr:exosortase/archaeosortase family protein [Terriglobia bacterium]
MRDRIIAFLLWVCVVTAAFWTPVHNLAVGSLKAGYSSHIVLVPFLVVYLLWSRRAEIFSSPVYAFRAGASIAAVALLALTASLLLSRTGWHAGSAITLLAAMLLIVAGFATLFGRPALRQAAFPLFLLILMLPAPSFVVDKTIYLLQAGSADLTNWMFSFLGVPVHRNGFVMTVPGASIEVAKECSGINSSVALFITVLIAAYETLHTTWRKIVLLVLSIPLSIVKNAVRIVALTLLATKVDPSFLTGRLHHEGGFVFFAITLGLMYPVWVLLRNGEKQEQREQEKDIRQPLAAAYPAAGRL